MKIVHEWLAELAGIPSDVETVAREISLRGFEVAGVENGVIDFEITANRPDCLSHAGIAREAHVIFGVAPRPRVPATSAARAIEWPLPTVTIEAPDLCPRYAAQAFEVTLGPSPDWLARRLEAAGVRPINNVVDVTNYVMLEIGQPMHAFDATKLAGHALIIRRARAGERVTTLDGVDRALDPEMLVIADADRAVAVAGVMGGLESEIGSQTIRMVLESAYFQPASVRRTSKRLGLKTEASTRFERGGDVSGPLLGLARAAELLQAIGAGVPGPIVDVYPAPQGARQVTLRAARIARVLGMDVPAAEVERILPILGFEIVGRDSEQWTVTVPSFRVDVAREVDLIEEVGRHFGFDRLPVSFPALTAGQAAPDPRIVRDRRVRALLTSAGLSESMTFAFIERGIAEAFCPPTFAPAAIANPLSESFAVLRPSLLPGLIDSASHNRRRGRKDAQLFEIGSRFTASGEGRAVGIVACGATAVHWGDAVRPLDFFDVKGVVELLANAWGIADLSWSAASESFLMPGVAAAAHAGTAQLAVVGQLAPALAESRGFPHGDAVFVAELDLDALTAIAPRDALRTRSLPRFPSIVRDVSLLLDEALPAADVRGTIRAAAPEILQSIVEFDRYQGKSIPEGRVSLSLRLTFRSPERTLTDAEVDAAMHTIVGALEREHRAERR